MSSRPWQRIYRRLVIAFLNQKGGVGKTSCCHHLAGTLSLMGLRVLLIDADPQASLTQGFWGPQAAAALDPASTVVALYEGSVFAPASLVRGAGYERIELVAGHRFAGRYNAPDPDKAADGLQFSLADFLDGLGETFDVALIDCPPVLQLCSWAALLASTHVVVPFQPEDYGVQGIGPVKEFVAAAQAGPNEDLRLLGLLPTMVDGREGDPKEYLAEIRAAYGDLLFDAVMPKRAAYKKAVTRRVPVSHYLPKSDAAAGMEAVAAEIFARVDGTHISAASPQGVA